MFKKLKEVFRKIIDTASISLTKGKLVSILEDYRIELISNDVAYEVVESLINELVNALEKGVIRDRESLVKHLKNTIKSYFTGLNWFNPIEEARAKGFYKIVFLGINGVGKTTTIAKLAYMYRNQGFKPIMVASDTFRAGAQEQLKIHGEKLGIPVFTGRYGSDPAAVAFDAVRYAGNRGYNVVLIDTAGRMHTDVDLVNELRKIIRVVNPDRRILVVDALTGNDAVEQARFFNQHVGVDGVIVTKIDAYEQGGVPLSIVYAIKKPVIMIGVGQNYDDLKFFNIDEFVDKILE